MTERVFLYLYGYIDYFFNSHLAEAFTKKDIGFYTLYLRKYARALGGQHPNYCRSIEEYFEEISMVIQEIKSKSSSMYLFTHSTGGLIASSYMNSGNKRHAIDAIILTSPFLDLN